jgi:hypothetical protein
MSGSRIVGNGSGGVVCKGRVGIQDCEISANLGVGLSCSDDSELRLVNTLVAGNSETGVWCRAEPAAIVHCTLVGNGESGLNGPQDSSEYTITNCIVWGNGEPLDEAYLPCVSSSCIQGWESTGKGDSIHRYPQFLQTGVYDFDRLNDDGLPDFVLEEGDWRLRPTSPCIDTGTADETITTDLEGHPRPSWYGVDLGAYEYAGGEEPHFLPAFRRGRVNGDSALNLSDAIFLLEHLFLGGETPGCLDSGDTNDDGALDLTDAVGILEFLYLGSAPPRDPFLHCAVDPTDDELDCKEFSPCDH